MTPYEHCILSVKNFKGIPEDYLDIHEFLDSTKLHYPNWKHRCILHNSFGMGLAEKFFGAVIKNSHGITISVREIVRRHIIEDLGFVPTIKDWLSELEASKETASKFNSPSKRDLEYLREFYKEQEEELRAEYYITSMERES